MSPAPALARLKNRAQFLYVRAGAKAVRPSLILEARRRAAAGPVGVGFTASRKVGDAVTRNRARRRLKEAARRLLPDLGRAGVDYVLVARAATAQTPWAGLLDDLRNALISLAPELDGPARGGKRGAPPKRAPPRARPPAAPKEGSS
jgi:ribonuclease P protein component